MDKRLDKIDQGQCIGAKAFYMLLESPDFLLFGAPAALGHSSSFGIRSWQAEF